MFCVNFDVTRVDFDHQRMKSHRDEIATAG